MPRQNRVTPFGDIIACPERGTYMGNRGILHDEDGCIRRSWQVKRWLICVLEFRGRHRLVMTPNRYTELFFLDEATGLAAGHRPCFECQRRRFNQFLGAWAVGNGTDMGADSIRAAEIDDRLHAERIGPNRTKQTFRENLDDLPDGILVAVDGRGGNIYLIQGEMLLAWSPGGYKEPLSRPKGREVTVLTPRSTVQAIRSGYDPETHVTAKGR